VSRGADHPRPERGVAIDRDPMAITPEVKTFVGSEVAVETTAGIVQGTLLSCTNRSLWVVAGEDDVMVLMTTVNSVHPLAAVG